MTSAIQTMTEFEEISNEKLNEFMAIVPEEYQLKARSALVIAYKVDRFDKANAIVAEDKVVEANRELLLRRSTVGIKKYGVTLENSNLSEEAILQHALEEALDLANYLQTRLMQIRKG